MSPNEKEHHARKAAELSAETVGLVARYLSKDLVPIVPNFTEEDGTCFYLSGVLQRLIAQLNGLWKLNRTLHFQLAVSGCRSILEMLVDAILLHHDNPKDALHRVETWELSSKLKSAEATLAYLRRKGQSPGEPERPLVEFVTRWKEILEKKREELWPDKKRGGGKHPPRWTNRSLQADVVKADEYRPLGLEHFYETEYRRMNWHVHGSGLVGVRGVDSPTIATIYALAQKMSGQLAINMAEVFLEASGLDRTEKQPLETMKLRWLGIVVQSHEHLAQVLVGMKNQDSHR